ncbi:MAG TPA: polyhydroxyalkanoic acid system family protein [Candidatus Paceibacterota bacterium]|jgi:hypothetical protein|nr:polyhydroxyalkanoic acid system family protein [Candidatus Paceibacterota bacterium]
MHIALPHKGTKDAAKQQVQTMLAEGRSKFGDQVQLHEDRWEDDTLHFDLTAQGQRISGTLRVEDSQFVLDAKLPLMLRLFEGRIEREVAEQVKKLQQ